MEQTATQTTSLQRAEKRALRIKAQIDTLENRIQHQSGIELMRTVERIDILERQLETVMQEVRNG